MRPGRASQERNTGTRKRRVTGINPQKKGSEGPEELCHSVHVSLQWGTYCHSYPNPFTSDSSPKRIYTAAPSENPDTEESAPIKEQDTSRLQIKGSNTSQGMAGGRCYRNHVTATPSTHRSLNTSNTEITAYMKPALPTFVLSLSWGHPRTSCLCSLPLSAPPPRNQCVLLILPLQSFSNPCPPLLHC